MNLAAAMPKPYRWERPTLSDAEYVAAEAHLRSMWEAHLKPRGVKFPSAGRLPAFVLLSSRPGAVITLEEIADFYQSTGRGKYDRQFRQVVTWGWWIESGSTRASRFPMIQGNWKSDHVRLASLIEPNPLWKQGRKLTVSLTNADWRRMLAEFRKHGRGCAVCGRHFDRYDRGHLDPEKPGTAGNIVPMCVDCNNWAANKVGPVHSLAFEFDATTLGARSIIQTTSAARKAKALRAVQ